MEINCEIDSLLFNFFEKEYKINRAAKSPRTPRKLNQKFEKTTRTDKIFGINLSNVWDKRPS